MGATAFSRTFKPLLLITTVGFILFSAIFYLLPAYIFAQQQGTNSGSYLRDATIDETGSRLFLLHQDSAVSIYDVAKKQFLISRKQIPGLTNAIDVTVSPDGDWLALVNGGVAMGDPAELFLAPTAQLLAAEADFPEILRYPLGMVRGTASRFTPDGETFVIANTVQGKMQGFNIKERVKYEIKTGKSPSALTFDSLGTRLFVLNASSNDVSVIDFSKKKLVSNIPVGIQPSAILFNKTLKRVFVSNNASGSVSVINPETLKAEKEVRVGSQPGSLTYDPKSGSVFVANNGDGTISLIAPDLTVQTIDLASPAYHRSAPLVVSYSTTAGRLFVLNKSTTQYFVFDTRLSLIKEGKSDAWPQQLLASEKSSQVFVRHFENAPLIIDLSTLYEEKIPLIVAEEETKYFSSPQNIAIDEEVNKIYVSNVGSGTITVIDGENYKPVMMIRVPQAPQVIALNTATKKLYVSSQTNNIVTVIDVNDPAYPQKTIEVGKAPTTISVNEISNKIYVSNSGEGSISVIDGDRDVLMKAVDLGILGKFPLVSTVNRKKNELYIVNYGGDTITVLDGATDTVKKFISVGNKPIWVRYYPDSDQVYVSVEGEKKVVRIDPETYNIVESFSLANIPYRIFYDKRTKLVYVNHRKDESVTVIKPTLQQAGRGEVITEQIIPYYGQTDTIYNMLNVDWKRELAYITYGVRNQVIVVKLERHRQTQILQPRWFATILENGQVMFNPEFAKEARLAPSRKIYENMKIILVSLILIFMFGGFGYWFWRRRHSQIA